MVWRRRSAIGKYVWQHQGLCSELYTEAVEDFANLTVNEDLDSVVLVTKVGVKALFELGLGNVGSTGHNRQPGRLRCLRFNEVLEVIVINIVLGVKKEKRIEISILRNLISSRGTYESSIVEQIRSRKSAQTSF